MTEGSRLFVADAWRGLLEVDVSIQPTEAELLGKLPSENVKVLSNSSTDGERILFADGLEIDKKGVNLYLTSLSQRSRIDVFAFCCFEDPPSGRLYRHNLSTGVTEVLLDRLPQPNGVVRSHDGNSLLVVLSGSKGKLRISCLTLESPSTILLDIRYAKPTCLQVQRLSADMVRSCRSTQ
eukprot:GHVS01104891.1.p1 GENE.GHVS01104891.1~~GHVS01104891.1.p1  ORF type:complete len:180 (+),score=4.57 GHVS01104891.1:850-1389(+)